MSVARLAATWLLLAFCTLARAHSGGTIGFATVTIDASAVRYSLALGAASITPELAARLRLAQPGVSPDYAPLLTLVEQRVTVRADGAPCPRAAGEVVPPATRGASTVVIVRFECPAAPRMLTLRDDLFDVLGSDYHTLANIQSIRSSHQIEFDPGTREAHVDLERPGPGNIGWFRSGVEHVLLGVEHVLFVLALVLRDKRLWSPLRLVTAFTVAQTATLALAVLAAVSVPDWLVEVVIGVAVAYVAAESLFLKRAVSQAWMVSVFIGLVHGMSASLRELGLPAAELIWPLLSFGAGVETGQALVIVAALPILLWLKQFKWARRALLSASAVVLLAGLILVVEGAWPG
jgi:hypothetical protein